MEWGSLFLFLLVYFGMILGNWPGLAIDRTGIALLGAIAFIEFQNIPLARIPNYIDLSALAILFSFMIISAQFYFSGFYTRVVAVLLFLHILDISFTVGFSTSIGVRDLGLAFSAFSIFLNGPDGWCIDQIF